MRYFLKFMLSGLAGFTGKAFHYHSLNNSERHEFWKRVQMTGMLAMMPFFVLSGFVSRLMKFGVRFMTPTL